MTTDYAKLALRLGKNLQSARVLYYTSLTFSLIPGACFGRKKGTLNAL